MNVSQAHMKQDSVIYGILQKYYVDFESRFRKEHEEMDEGFWLQQLDAEFLSIFGIVFFLLFFYCLGFCHILIEE